MGDSYRQPMYPGGYFHIYNRGNPRIIANSPGMLNRQHLLDRFGSLNEFIEFHRDRRSKVAAAEASKTDEK